MSDEARKPKLWRVVEEVNRLLDSGELVSDRMRGALDTLMVQLTPLSDKQRPAVTMIPKPKDAAKTFQGRPGVLICDDWCPWYDSEYNRCVMDLEDTESWSYRTPCNPGKYCQWGVEE